jgi:hypothetical protein|tara:strand:- start:1285 stop:1905 length:621 start_codon:yes stop_codon:yes gene_type:complete
MLNEALHGTTDMAMNSQRSHGDETLLVKFFLHPKQNQIKTKEAGRPIFEDIPYIQIMQPGNKDSVKVAPATARDKQRFPEHYRKFVAREDQEALEGTPLREWAGVTASQCKEFEFLNILTVEQLAAVSDSNGQGIMGLGFLKEKAAKFIENAKLGATAEALAEMKAENASLLERLEALEAGEPAPKKKRGRPAKNVEEVLQESQTE